MFITKRMKQRQRIALYLTVVVVAFFVIGHTWQVFASGGSEAAQNIEEIADKIIKFASRWWIFFAIVAGKLMTNTFVYGTILHLDVNLRQIWQVMRSFANFGLGFLFVAYILKSFFGDAWLLKSKLPMIIVSAVLVQASWFMMAVLIDLSTIGMAAVWSLPLQVLGEQRDQQKYTFKMYERTYIDQSFSVDMERTAKTKSNLVERKLEDILPKADSVSGPLIFMGASVLHTLDYNFLTQEKLDIGATAVIILLKAVVLIMFFLPILALVIINMIRVFWIWIRVVMSPWIVLDYLVLDKALSKRSKIFDIGQVLGLIFQPVAVVWLMSMWLILVIGMGSIIAGDNDFDKTKESFQQQLNYKTISDNTAQVGDPDIGVAYVRGNLFDSATDYVGWFFGQMILFIFVIMLLWAIIKAANNFSDITKDAVGSMYTFAEGLMKSAPIIPFAWGVSYGAAEQAKGEYERQVRKNTIWKRQAKEEENRWTFLAWFTNAPVRDIKKTDLEEIKHTMGRIVQRDGRLKLETFAQSLRTVMQRNPKLQLAYGVSERFTSLMNSVLQDEDVLRELWRNTIIGSSAAKAAAYKANPAELIDKEVAFSSFITNLIETWQVDRSKKTGAPNIKGKVFTMWSTESDDQ